MSQADFAAALLAEAFVCPPGIITRNGADPARCFAVHRNNVIVSLVDALAESCPVTQALVGDEFFRAMARKFVHQTPPRSPVLAWYGEGFAEFIEIFAPTASLPYLADVARLELLYVEAFHAADASPLPTEALTALLAVPDALPSAGFVLHPALRLLRSRYPIVSLWMAHQTDEPELALGQIDLGSAEAALLLRPGLELDVVRIEAGAADFIAALQSGMCFGEAAGTVESFDLVAILGLLIQHGAIIGLSASVPAS